MKKSISVVITVFAAAFIAVSAFAGQGGHPVQSNVASGDYIPHVLIKIKDLKKMPVPNTNEDYAFIQSIDNETNVVIGRFTSGQREVLLLKDKNSDGVVDLAVQYFVGKNKFKYSARPSREWPKEKFEKIKLDIINGVQGEFKPNKEGSGYIKALQKNSERVKHWKNGYRVFLMDPDDDTSERLNYFFSISSDGADLVFEVKYRNEGVARISPVINFSVYCKDSKDAFIIEQTKKFIEDAAKFVPVSD